MSADDQHDRLRDIEESLMGGPRAFSRDQAIDELGIDADYADELWRSFGFARDDRDSDIFTEDDLAALGMVIAAYGTEPNEMAIAAARTIGQTMARLADWQADKLYKQAADADNNIPLGQLSSAIERVQTLVWRRHLASAVTNLTMSTSDVDGTVETVVGFADIVGYTSLSRKITTTELSTLLEYFESQANTTVANHGGQVIKTLGDAVLFSVADPLAGVEIAWELHRISATESMPALRVGIAYGHVVNRFGDIFGEPVNIASRLAGAARPGTSLCHSSIADVVDDERYYLKSIGTLNVRGYRHLKARTIELNRKL